MKMVINSAPSRRHFLRLTSMAAASALAPTVLWAEQQEAADSATSQAVPARVATFEEVWQTVRDRFYDPHLHGLDWSAVRERYLPDATRASSEEALARVINSMLSELHASHTRYYTPYEPEYYQLSDIFAGTLRRRGLERVFPSGRISYPGIGVLSRLDMQGRSMITGVIEGTSAQQAGLLAGDVIVLADGAPKKARIADQRGLKPAAGIADEFGALGRGSPHHFQSLRPPLGELESPPAKRLLQQDPPTPDVPIATRMTHMRHDPPPGL
jgi:carboxyl-terminal processing protease